MRHERIILLPLIDTILYPNVFLFVAVNQTR